MPRRDRSPRRGCVRGGSPGPAPGGRRAARARLRASSTRSGAADGSLGAARRPSRPPFAQRRAPARARPASRRRAVATGAAMPIVAQARRAGRCRAASQLAHGIGSVRIGLELVGPAPRRAPRGRAAAGSTSSSTAPPATPRSVRSTTRSPTRSGSGSAKVSRAVSGPIGRSVQLTVAVPAWTSSSRGRSAGVQSRVRTSATAVQRYVPGVASASPRSISARPGPRKFNATRATPDTSAACSFSAWISRTTNRSPVRASSTVSPVWTVPAARVPVTTRPAPRMVKLRSIHSRTGAAGSLSGNRPTSVLSSARSSARPAPVRALTRDPGQVAQAGAARSARAPPRRRGRAPSGRSW